MASLSLSVTFAILFVSCVSQPSAQKRPLQKAASRQEAKTSYSYFCWFVEQDPNGHRGYAWWPGALNSIKPGGWPRHTSEGYTKSGLYENLDEIGDLLTSTNETSIEICPRYPSSPVAAGWRVRALTDAEAESLRRHALPSLAVFVGNSSNVETQLVRNIRGRLPDGWNCTVYRSKDIQEVPHGLGKPEFEVVAVNTNVYFLKSEVPNLTKQNPVVPLYFYRHSEKVELMKVIEKERIYSCSIPMYFGETEKFVVVTSPAFVNGGVFTPEACHALRPAWAALQELIPNKEKADLMLCVE